MDVSFCVSAVEDALARFGKPEIFNTDQGGLPGLDPGITSAAFTGTLAARPASASRWMGAAGGWTTSSSSACGAA
jgi:putative transposase